MRSLSQAGLHTRNIGGTVSQPKCYRGHEILGASMTGRAARRTTTSDPVELRTDADGHRRLVATAHIATGVEILPLTGTVRPAPTRFSIQIGPDEHLDDMGPIDATNHSCEPSACIDFSRAPDLVLRALRDLAPGDEVSIHYGATEYDMASPFACGCGAETCVGTIRGYRHLDPAQRVAVRPLLRPTLRE